MMQWGTAGVRTGHIIETSTFHGNKTNEEKHSVVVNTLARYVGVKVHSPPDLKAFGMKN